MANVIRLARAFVAIQLPGLARWDVEERYKALFGPSPTILYFPWPTNALPNSSSGDYVSLGGDFFRACLGSFFRCCVSERIFAMEGSELVVTLALGFMLPAADRSSLHNEPFAHKPFTLRHLLDAAQDGWMINHHATILEALTTANLPTTRAELVAELPPEEELNP